MIDSEPADDSDEATLARDQYNLLASGLLCQQTLNRAFRTTLAILLGVLMLGMGAATKLDDFKRVVRKKKRPFIIGFAAQVRIKTISISNLYINVFCSMC